jgi:hypothetical protein
MKLREALERLDEFDDFENGDDELGDCITIWIKSGQEWTPEAEVVVEPNPYERVDAKPGYDYFLEVFVTREVLEGWVTGIKAGQLPPDYELPIDEACRVVIYYARNDAWPED